MAQSSFVTYQDVGHSVLGLSWQNRTEVGNKLWRTKVNNQLPKTITAQTDSFYVNLQGEVRCYFTQKNV